MPSSAAKKKPSDSIRIISDGIVKKTQDLHRIVKSENPIVPKVEMDPSHLTPIPVDCIPTELPLPCPLYVHMGKKYVMFRGQGDRLSLKRVLAFQRQDVTTLYIHNLFWNFFLRTLDEIELPEPVTPEKKIQHVRMLLAAYSEEFNKHIAQPKKTILDHLEGQSFSLAEEVFHNGEMALKFLKRTPDPISYFSNHPINTAIFAILIGKAVKLSLDNIKLLAFGAVVHNVGNAYVSKEILYKRGALTPEEWHVIHAHPAKGAELLNSMGCHPIIVRISHEHHERINGTGYPRKLVDKQIHSLTKIVSIADVYDAFRSDRPHQPGLPAETVIKNMKEQQKLFDPTLIASLYKKLD